MSNPQNLSAKDRLVAAYTIFSGLVLGTLGATFDFNSQVQSGIFVFAVLIFLIGFVVIALRRE